ncbi:MAG: hypothetical protein DSZ11_01810 [Sulfurovum sp.]|nr:MAG: hypothetical protein DSZ11_01810 [Sulfurovum sp.]
MHKIILLSLTLPLYLFSGEVVVPDDYKINTSEKIDYIYTQEYTKILPELKIYQEQIMHQYEKEFGFKLDEKMHVGIASDNNQIANAMVTPIPLNLQFLYGAGAGAVDYFCFDSWMKTILIHETAHNYQLNPKENWISKVSHKVFGNTYLSMLGPLLMFPIPNVLENPFILEGNAVLNESRFGNGGRLYSGYALAEVVAMANAGEIRPEMMYNSTLKFPYGEKDYIIGGFFQKFLMEKYGIQKVNEYFKTYSGQIVPIFTSSVFKKQFGKPFKTLLAEFVEDIKQKHQGFKATHGDIVAQSQFHHPFNSDEGEIYTLIGDYFSAPKILKFDKKSQTVEQERGSWRQGEVFKIENEYFTQTSAKTSPTTIVMGLYDEGVFLKEGTGSKVTQGFMPNGKRVYFDIGNSLEHPHIFIENSFYDTSSSSVHVDKAGNLYYFKQDKNQRTLYKNKKPLFSYQGHYGFVTDVDAQGYIYFIAKSTHGSTAYRYNGSTTQRITTGDDVIDLKLINNNEALVATMTAEGFIYQTVTLTPRTQSVTPTTYSIEDKSSKITKSLKPFQPSTPLASKDYNALMELQYSSLNQSLGYSSQDGLMLSLQANFVDPLLQNSVVGLVAYEENRTVVGLGYENSAFPLKFGATAFVLDHKEGYFINNENEDDHGYSLYLHLPFLASGYWRGSATLDYTKAFDSIYRKPLTFSVDFLNHKQYGFSRYPNHRNQLSLFLSEDRENQTYGASYSWIHDLAWQTFIGLNASYMQSDITDIRDEKGIRISDDLANIQNEKVQILMPTINETLYAKEATTAEVSLRKTFDTPLYFFSSPISLQRETLYLKHKIYDLELLEESKKFSESTLGLTSDVVLLNQFVLPLSMEIIYNKETTDKTIFRVLVSEEF